MAQDYVDPVALAIASHASEPYYDAMERYEGFERIVAGPLGDWVYETLLGDHGVRLEPDALEAVKGLVVLAMLRQHQYDERTQDRVLQEIFEQDAMIYQTAEGKMRVNRFSQPQDNAG